MVLEAICCDLRADSRRHEEILKRIAKRSQTANDRFLDEKFASHPIARRALSRDASSKKRQADAKKTRYRNETDTSRHAHEAIGNHQPHVYRVPVMKVRGLNRDRDADACDAIIAGLPEWFGSEQGIQDCAAAVRSQDGLVVVDDAVLGFVTWQLRQDRSAEITWMAVRADLRRHGIGRLLLGALVDHLRDCRVRRLDVKTLSGRDPYPPYVETRAFYRNNGFIEVAELDVWGPENPAVLLSREL